jgi:hypothetical protein
VPSALVSLQVDQQLYLGRPLDRQISRVRSFANLSGVGADQTVTFRFIGSVAHQAAGRDERAIREDRWHRAAERQCAKLRPGLSFRYTHQSQKANSVSLQLANGTATPTTQCGSKPVSGRGLPKTGIFRHVAGDFRRFRPESGQIRSLETDCQFAKARYWRAFLWVLGVVSLSGGLVGWRRSADRTGAVAPEGRDLGSLRADFESRNRWAAVTSRAIP